MEDQIRRVMQREFIRLLSLNPEEIRQICQLLDLPFPFPYPARLEWSGSELIAYDHRCQRWVTVRTENS